MHMKYTKRGFTLIELLVVVAIIAILAVIVMFAVGQARLKAKDAAVMSSLASYRNTAELEFAGDYTGLCESESYVEIGSYVELQGGEMLSCQGENEDYVIVATLPSGNESSLSYLVHTAYAREAMQMELEGSQVLQGSQISGGLEKFNNIRPGGETPSEEKSSYCINSHGASDKISLASYVRLQNTVRNYELAEAGVIAGQQQLVGQQNISMVSSFRNTTFCTTEDAERVIGKSLAQYESALDLESGLGGGNYSEYYEYTCIDEETGEMGCIDSETGEDVSVDECDNDNAAPISCGDGGGYQVIIPGGGGRLPLGGL